MPLPLAEQQARTRQRWSGQHFSTNRDRRDAGDSADRARGHVPRPAGGFSSGFLAARNTTPHRFVHYGVRTFLDRDHTIPDLALGLLFVAAVGLGAFAGTPHWPSTLPLCCGKLLSESGRISMKAS